MTDRSELARSLLERMTGEWDLTGQMGAVALRQRVDARWSLGGRYVDMRCIQADPAPGTTPYEAAYFIGFEPETGRMVMHLLDSTAVVAERNVGTGHPEADAVTFTFPYERGPFTNRFTYDASRDAWTHELVATVDGERRPFATKHLVRRDGG
jgi:hypothetical protein